METTRFQVMPQKDIAMQKLGCVQKAPSEFDPTEPYTYTFLDKVKKVADLNQKAGLDYYQPREEGKLDQSHVNSLALAAPEGNLPAPVYTLIEGEEIPVDGNHSLAGAVQSGAEAIRGYYMFCHPNPRLVASVLNRHTNGKGTDPKQALNQCVAAYIKERDDTGKEPDRTVFAGYFCLPVTDLNRGLRQFEDREKLASKGVRVIELTPAHIDAVSKMLRQDEESAAKLGKAAVQGGMTAKAVEEIAQGFCDPKRTLREKTTFLKTKIDEVRRITNNGTLPLKRNRTSKQGRKETALKDGLSKICNVSEEADEAKMHRFVQGQDTLLEKAKAAYKYLGRLIKP